VGNFTCLGITS